MSLNRFLHFFGFGSADASVDGPQKAPEQIIGYLFSLIDQKNLVAELAAKYKSASRQNTEKRLPELITIYTALERFITSHRPPVTQQEFTEPELRESIRNNFALEDLPSEMRLIFLPESEQTVYLCAIGSRELIKFLAGSMGLTPVQSIFSQVVSGNFLREASVTERGLEIEEALEAAKHTSPDDILASFKVLNASLFQEIINVLGEKSALELVQRVYESVKERYDTNLISRFLEALPLGVLESERATFLSKEDLGRKIQERTEELLEAQRELRLERDRAKAIISSIGEGLVTLDAKYLITSLNAAAERLLGLKTAEVLGTPWDAHITVRKAHETSHTFLERAIQHGEMVSTGLDDELSFATKEREFPVATITTPLSKNGIAGAVIVFRDITQEKEANDLIEREVAERTREVQEGRTRLMASINSLKLGFLMTNSELGVIVQNESAGDILQNTAIQSLDELNPLFEGSIDLTGAARDVMTRQAAVDFDGIVSGKQYLRIYISPISHQNSSIGCAVLVEDVTEARVLARSKDEFFTIASHELRTPLIAIRGYASMIKEFYPDKLPGEDLIRMVDRIDASGQRLITIVNSFLDVSRLEQGKMEFKPENINLNELTQASIDELQSVAKEKKVELQFTANEAVPPLYADKNLTKQVLYNLIGNGIKFTQEGSVHIEARREDDHVIVIIKDTGAGIPLEAQSLLFRKFQQTGDSLFTRDNSQGTGLGLYISKLIIERMGGTIGLRESEVGKGSTFYFTLPLSPDNM